MIKTEQQEGKNQAEKRKASSLWGWPRWGNKKEEKQPVTRMTAPGMELAFFNEAMRIKRENDPWIGGGKNVRFSLKCLLWKKKTY